MQERPQDAEYELDHELNRRATADRAIRKIRAVEDFQIAKREEEERRRQWEMEHRNIRRLPQRSHNITPDHPVFAHATRSMVRNDGPQSVTAGP